MTPTPTPAAILGFIPQGDPIVPVLFNIVRALVILLVALVLAGVGKRWAVRLLSRGRRVNLNMASLVGNLVQITIVSLGVINLLPAFGVDLASLITVLGVAGIAISLSLQDLLRNVVAGIYILLEQPFKIGDRISVKETTGVVQGIGIRTTILHTDEGLQVVVPNNTVLTEIVTNRSAIGQQKAAITMRIAITDLGDLEKVSQEINALMAGIPSVSQTPSPAVVMEGTYEGTARLRVEFWLPAGQKATVASQVVNALRARWPEADMTVVG